MCSMAKEKLAEKEMQKKKKKKKKRQNCICVFENGGNLRVMRRSRRLMATIVGPRSSVTMTLCGPAMSAKGKMNKKKDSQTTFGLRN